MKHLNFLSNLLSLSLGSPCTDVSLDCRLTVGSPSGLDAKWKQNPFMRFAVVLTLIFTIGIGNVWGATQNFVPGDFSGGTSGTGSTVNKTLNGIQVSTDKGYATTQFRVYKGGKLTISSDYTIKAINFTTNSSYGGGLSNQTNLTTTSWSFTTTAQARITQIVVTYLAKVTFNANEGSCATSNLTQATASSSITLPTPTRSGYICKGWYTASSGGTKRGNAGATYTPTVSETLYAQWEADAPAYTITAARNNASYGNVSLSGTTITATPAACCEYASPAYTVSPAGSATVSQDGNAFTVTPSANTTVTINFQEKSAGKTVNFDAGAGVCATASLTEDCDGAGVVLPSVTASGVCKGWTTFAGWRASAIATADSTTTNPGTLYAAGSTYYPSSNGETLYAVFSKTKSTGGSSGSVVVTHTSTNFPDGYGTANTFTEYTLEGYKFKIQQIYNNSKMQWRASGNSNGTGTIYNTETFPNHITSIVIVYTNDDSNKNISLKVGTSENPTSGTSITPSSSSNTYTFDCSGGTYDYFVLTNGSGAGYTSSVTINYGSTSTTYYCSDPNCCTALGSINGSVSWSNPTQAVVTWDKLDDQVSAWALSWSPNTTGSSITSAIADYGLTQKTATVSGLACGTAYTFTLTPTVKSGTCPVDVNPTIVSTSSKYTITRSGSPAGTVTGGTFVTLDEDRKSITQACEETPIELEATPANGYEFSTWQVTETASGDAIDWSDIEYIGDEDEDDVYIVMPASAITVTAVFACATPAISVHPASKLDYITTDAATALTVTADANSGTLGYQWQISDDNSSWEDIDDETSYSYTPDISSAGTTYYRVVVTNETGSCSTTATSNVATITSVTPSVCKTPTFSVSEGTYTTSKSVELSCGTDGATIYYTTNGNTPTTGSTEYTGAISVTQTTTIKAIAVKDGLSASLVASATYTIQCATPTFSVTAGTYVGSKSVEISTTYGTTIYYTTNGDNPTTGSTAYSSAITVGTSQTVKAIAVKSGCTNSAVGSAAYTIQCAAPTFSPTAGTYNANKTVYLSSTHGDNFYYTLDNSTPTTESTLYDSKTGISITASKTLKAIATKTGCDNSSVASATYTMKCATPTFSVAAGTYTGAQTVAISSTTPGVSIYYTTNGATPTTSSTAYSSAITVSTNQTVKAIAVKDGWTNSDVGQAAYTIQYAVTWKVNDVALTGDDLGSANTLVTYNSKVTNLPPDPDDDVLNNCANKFMGWSRHDFGTTPKTTASGQYDDLFTTAGGSTAITGATTFYAVFAEQTVTGDEGYYKVTSTGDITNDGRYLIVNETNGVVFDGSLSTLDAGNNVVSVTITSSSIVITKDNESTLADAEFTIDMTNKCVKSHSNKYIYQSTYSNGMSESTEATAVQSISIDGSGNFVVEGTGRNGSEPKDYVVLRFNSTTGSSNYRFRFYKGTQNLIQLYKYDSGVTTENYVTQCADTKVRVTYDFNGGTGTACTEGVTTKSASYTVCSTEPDKDYYDFAGWNDGTSTYGAGDTYNLQATTEFEAQWTPTVYTITYNLNGGTQQVTPAAPTSYTYESSAVTLPTPTKNHDRFDGWYGNADLSTGGVQTTIAAGSNGNKVYYAKWTERHTIKFYKDDELLATLYRASDENLEAAASGTLSGQGAKPSDPSAPSACGSKVFVGWTETWFNDETNTAPGDLSDATGKKTADKNYYAVWATRAGSPGSYTYSAYSTTCCGKSVEVDGGSPSNGTVTFDKSYVWTCKEDREIVMTITPAAGYQLHTFSVATGSGKVAAKSMSADVDLDNNSSAAQVITLTFAKDADGAYDVTATFTEMTVTSWTWTYNSGDIPDPIDVYVGQKKQIDVVMSPSGVLTSHKNNLSYTYDVNSTYIGNPNRASAYFTFEGKAATESTTITLTHNDDTSSPKAFPQTVNVRVKPLPLVHFVDNVHNESFDDVVATVSGDKLSVSMEKTTPTHVDFTGSTANSCEETHLHLIGWIRGDWPAYVAYMNGTGSAPSNSDLTGATGYFYAPGASITLTDAMHGMTFYAIWAKVE